MAHSQKKHTAEDLKKLFSEADAISAEVSKMTRDQRAELEAAARAKIKGLTRGRETAHSSRH